MIFSAGWRERERRGQKERKQVRWQRQRRVLPLHTPSSDDALISCTTTPAVINEAGLGASCWVGRPFGMSLCYTSIADGWPSKVGAHRWAPCIGSETLDRMGGLWRKREKHCYTAHSLPGDRYTNMEHGAPNKIICSTGGKWESWMAFWFLGTLQSLLQNTDLCCCWRRTAPRPAQRSSITINHLKTYFLRDRWEDEDQTHVCL